MLDILSPDKLRSYDWANPEQAWLLWLVAAALIWGLLKWGWGLRAALALHPREKTPRPWVAFAAWLPRGLRGLALALMVIALMRPQNVTSSPETSVQSIDIYLALDVSESMHADDVKPDRLEGAKVALKRFVDGLPGDRIGMVVFAGKAFTQCPLSLDHEVVKFFIDRVRLNSIGPNGVVPDGTVAIGGTALGDGLLLAVQRLIQEPRRGQVIVIATDGRSNAGQPPIVAAEVAAKAGIKVYTVGIGAKGGGFIRWHDAFGRALSQKMEEPDEALMTQMAEMSGGRYFRANDEKSLSDVYAMIAKMERREIKVKSRREADEHFYQYLYLAALLLLAEMLLRVRLRVVY